MFVLDRLCNEFGDYELADLSVENILDFMNRLTEGRKPQTKRGRFTSLLAFFNFVKNNLDTDFINPCDSPMLSKLFRLKIKPQYDILEKEIVDEIIFRTVHPRNRLMLELMARGAMRIGEVLKIVPNDVSERKILLRDPKSGREFEMIFIPQKVADRLREYIENQKIGLQERIFPICYETARSMVEKAGKLVGIHLRPHDLRRHAATFASRSGVPLEIVSKIILRHSNLSTTQIYLGRISDTEALKWIETIYS
ncbi:tyrosine-type recombinase/integrase [Thermodesulfobacteriota bacterium]